jgi:hypothetical protein
MGRPKKVTIVDDQPQPLLQDMLKEGNNIEPILEQTVQNDSQPVEPDKEIASFMSDYTEKPIINEEAPKSRRGRKKKEEEPQQDPPIINGEALINGGMFILLIDLLLPNIICLLNNRLSKKKIKASKLQMTAEQRKDLEPIANEVAKQMSMKANPMTVLIISLVGIYGVNFMMLKADDK